MEHPRHQYPRETAALQAIAQSCGLVEKIKWGKPCFTLHSGDAEKNIVLIQRFNHYIALMFFKGVLLKDLHQLLYRIGKTMQAPRQLRFTSVDQITQHDAAIRDLIHQAIQLEASGARIAPRKPAELELPAEFQSALDSDPAFRAAFHALTPGRQKGYIYQIAQAKQPATRTARIAKLTPRILAGLGLND